MKYGDKVKILRSTYKGLVGYTGTVYTTHCDVYQNSIAVKIDGKNNNRSKYGVYYFKKSDIELLEGETDMNNIMDGNYRVAKVQFLDGNKPCNELYACYDKDVEVGSICVVKPAHHPYALAKVTELYRQDVASDTPVIREIVCIADFTAYEKRVENRSRKRRLMSDMKKRADMLQETALFEMLAKADPEMQRLLNEYKEVSGHECEDV